MSATIRVSTTLSPLAAAVLQFFAERQAGGARTDAAPVLTEALRRMLDAEMPGAWERCLEAIRDPPASSGPLVDHGVGILPEWQNLHRCAKCDVRHPADCQCPLRYHEAFSPQDRAQRCVDLLRSIAVDRSFPIDRTEGAR